ncbi:MAG: hypothetical protein AAF639_29380, partial [Chloroflexota bacterium]
VIIAFGLNKIWVGWCIWILISDESKREPIVHHITKIVDMVNYWFALGFIRDQNPDAPAYPYFVETERNDDQFVAIEFGMNLLTGFKEDEDTSVPMFYIEREIARVRAKGTRGAKLADYLEQRAFKPVRLSRSRPRVPRSGTRMRR